MKRVEGVDVEFPADVSGAVGPEDVEGEGAHAGELAGVGSDSAAVLEEGNVADVVVPIFYPPVIADGVGSQIG